MINDDSKKKRGYKLSTLRRLMDEADVTEEIKFGSI